METKSKQPLIPGWTPTKLASSLGGITPQAISQWKKVPVGRVLEVENVTGVSRHDLRPDIYGTEPQLKRKKPKPSLAHCDEVFS